MGYYLEMFGVSLGLTLIIEGVTAFVLGLRGKYRLIIFVLVNVITNPVAVLLNYVSGLYLTETLHVAAFILIETGVFITEALIYRSSGTCEECRIKNPFVFSMVLNGISCFSGIAANLCLG